MVLGTWTVARPIVAWLAGWVVRRRGDAVSLEFLRTVFHSTLGTWIFTALGISPADSKLLSMLAAFVRTTLI